jgi:group I intron endonuclease
MIQFDGNKDDLDKCGIYRIINLQDGKQYIGSASVFKYRLYDHSNKLKNNEHHNPIMQHAFTKYGSSVFRFEIAEILSNDEQREQLVVEQRYLDEIFKIKNHYYYYYNVAKNASAPMIGRRHTYESIKKMSGENNPSFGKRGPDSPNFGRKHSPETIAKLKERPPNLGREWTDDQKKHLSEKNRGCGNPRFGQKVSDATKKLISDSNRGAGNPRYISKIEAKNIETGEIIIGSSYSEIAEKIGVSKVAIQRRFSKTNKKYTMTPIKSVWVVSRINNEGK